MVGSCENPLLDSFSNIVEILRHRGESQKNKKAFTFLLDGEREEASISFGDLDQKARRIAIALRSLSPPGKRATLLYSPGLDYITGFLGCLYAGIIAVPIYPPDPGRLSRTLPRLQAILKDCQPNLILSTQQVHLIGKEIFPQLEEESGIKWVETDNLPTSEDLLFKDIPIDPQSVAFLQYTSGSTREPKGVIISHKNLIYNLRQFLKLFDQFSQTVGVSWLPPYHDMGLVAGILYPIFGGFHTILFSPLDFLKKPIRWLQAITRYGGTISPAPNFAFDLCVRKISQEEKAELNLKSWKFAVNGAEPIRSDTLKNFSSAFEMCGFNPKAFFPCYGLAEATLMVSGGPGLRPPKIKKVDSLNLTKGLIKNVSKKSGRPKFLVSCGNPREGTTVRIINPRTNKPTRSGQIGEIWAAGPGIASGYWNNPDETRKTFQAFIQGTREGPFFRTGDLGYLDKEDLYLTGRLKDLIIIRGQNYYPQDIEQTVYQSYQGLRPGCGAAFSMEIGKEERLVVVQEIDRRFHDRRIERPHIKPFRERRTSSDRRINELPPGHDPEIRGEFDFDKAFQNIRRSVAEHHEIDIHQIVFIKPGTIPKTSSGKIQRYACKQAHIQGNLEILAGRTFDSEKEEKTDSLLVQTLKSLSDLQRKSVLKNLLKGLLQDRLGISKKEITNHKALLSYGLDSLQAVDLEQQIESNLEIKFPQSEILGGINLGDFTDKLNLALKSAVPGRKQPVVPPVPSTSSKKVDTLEIPASAGQERLWFLDQLASNIPNYLIPWALKLKGQLNLNILERCLNEIRRRHETLRTTFRKKEGKLYQVISPFRWEKIQEFQLKNASDSQIPEAISCPLDSEKGPLFRAVLFKGKQDTHQLVLIFHHLLADGWSISRFLYEFETLYRAYSKGMNSPLAELPMQFSDFIQKEIPYRSETPLGKDLDYWKKQLEGMESLLHLPLDHPRPLEQTFKGAWVPFALSKPKTKALKQLGQKFGVTPFMTLLAVFKTLLFRYSGQTDLCIGTAVANRPTPESRALIAPLANSVVLRTDLSGDPAFKELLLRVRETCALASEHGDFPFDRLVEALKPERSLAHTPVIQAMFILDNTLRRYVEGFTLPNLKIKAHPLENNTSKRDISFHILETRKGFRGFLEYDSGLFENSTMQQLVSHYQYLIKGILKNPGQTISKISLLRPSERKYFLQTGTAKGKKKTKERFLHQQIQDLAETHPAKTAIIGNGRDLSFSELNRSANQLANYLRKKGVKPGSSVGISCDRSTQIIIAMLGILKAGGAYIPLDPNYPQERLDFIRKDANISHLLVEEALSEGWRNFSGTLINLDREKDAIIAQNDEDFRLKNPDSHKDRLAYLFYTSGSTGNPKGVMITQRNLSHYLDNLAQSLKFHPRDRVLFTASFGFASSIRQLWHPLSQGATVVIATMDEFRKPTALFQLIKKYRVTIADFVPSYWRSCIEALEGLLRGTREEILKNNLRRIITASEPLFYEIVNRWREDLGQKTEIINSCGQTESTGTVFTFSVPRGHRDPRQPVPIGKAIPNTPVYILDPLEQPVPMGVPGELYIGGQSLAKGYLHLSKLTRKKFISNPFLKSPGKRLFKTGDRVRWLKDGNVEFIGRSDSQLKIRGFRVEPGEIESLLRRHPRVKEAILIGQKLRDESITMVAFITEQRLPPSKRTSSSLAYQNPALSAGLKDYLRKNVPSYMIPSGFIFIENLPLTPTGKLDRKILKNLNTPEKKAESGEVPLKTETEIQLADIWKRLLGKDRISAEGDFFELGGHSLIIPQLLNGIYEKFGIDFPLKTIFEAPTLRNFALEIENRLWQEDSSHLLAKSKTGQTPLKQEAELDPDIAPRGPTILTFPPQNIFLTGPSGFLGSYLLANLLQLTHAKIHCLMRASDSAVGYQKLKNILINQKIWNPLFEGRIIVVTGDLSKKYFGIPTKQFEELGAIIDTIYHCGAQVSLLAPYSQLKSTNVFGTQETFRLAVQGRTKPVHHVSTLAVFENKKGVLQEDSDIGDGEGLSLGYSQSKWVAEQLCFQAKRIKIPLTIYRLGRIVGDSRTGYFPPEDLLAQIFKTCIETAQAPSINFPLQMIPVDLAAKAITHLSLNGENLGRIFHVVDPHPLLFPEMISWVRDLGYPLQTVEGTAWLNRFLETSPETPLAAYFPLLKDKDILQEWKNRPRYRCEKTQKVLPEDLTKAMIMDRKLIRKYLKYMIDHGYLASPEQMIFRKAAPA